MNQQIRAAELTADRLRRPIRIDPGDQGFVIGRAVRIQQRQAGGRDPEEARTRSRRQSAIHGEL